MADIKAEIAQLAQADQAEINGLAAEVAAQAACNEREQQQIAVYLAQIPGVIRQSQKRSEDPSGRTISGSFRLAEATDMAKLLPPSLPRFVAGDDFPGKGGWKLERLLGTGGFGEVWLARHKHLDSFPPVAAKFCRSGGNLQHEANVINRLRKCGKHANIVTLNDADPEGNPPWLVYDYIEGGDFGGFNSPLGRLIHCRTATQSD